MTLLDLNRTDPNIRKLLQDFRETTQKESFSWESYYNAASYQKLIELLSVEDQKARKIIIGLCKEYGNGLEEELLYDLLKELANQYESEKILFLKSSYLKTMLGLVEERKLDKNKIYEAKKAKARLQFLESALLQEDGNKKHYLEEQPLLVQWIAEEMLQQKKFLGTKRERKVLLTVSEVYRNACKDSLTTQEQEVALWNEKGVILPFKAGKKMHPNLFYQKMLFIVRKKKGFLLTLENIGDMVHQSELMPLLKECLGESAPYTFRIAFSENIDSKKTKALIGDLERQSHYQLRNARKETDVIFHVFLTKETCQFYVEFCKIIDNRFAYRKHMNSTSMAPQKAALMVSKCQDYFKKDAQILDCFCGMGTLLIERNRKIKAREIYGIDTYGDCVLGARENAELANMSANFINRSFFDFQHSYLFDEIICEFPRFSKEEGKEVDEFYSKFYKKSQELLVEDGLIFALSNEHNIMKKQLRLHTDFTLVRQISMGEKEDIYIIKKRG